MRPSVSSQNSVQANTRYLRCDRACELRIAISVPFRSVLSVASDLSQAAIGVRLAPISLRDQIGKALLYLLTVGVKRISIEGPAWLVKS
jgi:hypothetical protein